MNKYKVIRMSNGRVSVFKTCSSKDEALEEMDRQNTRLVNRAYRKALRKGRSSIGYEAYRMALTHFAVQY